MAKKYGCNICLIRKQCYELRLYRMRLNFWTDQQVAFLKANYKIMGDTELAELFNEKFKRRKHWTKKHIDKKRGYLKLKRTKKQIIEIEQRNLDQGRLNCHMKKGKSNFLTTGPAVQGEIRMYKYTHGVITSRIRIGKRWIYWPRWAYKKHHGPIPKGYVIVMKDKNAYNTIPSNLEAVTREEATRRHVSQYSINLSDAYVAAQLSYGNPELREIIKNDPVLIETKRTLLLLKREIKKRKNGNNRKKAA
jgi:hypothetical protein